MLRAFYARISYLFLADFLGFRPPTPKKEDEPKKKEEKMKRSTIVIVVFTIIAALLFSFYIYSQIPFKYNYCHKKELLKEG